MPEEIKPLLDLSGNPQQTEFIYSKHKFTGFYGGIGNGKSFGGNARGIWLNEVLPGNVGLVGRLTYPELWDTTEKGYLEIIRKRNGGTLDATGNGYVKSFNQTKNILEIYNGSLTYFRYLQNIEAILSLNLGWFYVDQAEFVAEEVYEHLEGRLRLWSPDKIADCAKEHKRIYGKPLKYVPKHFGFITGNPAPGWVHRRYKQGLKKDGKPFEPNPYHLIEAPSEANKKNLPPGYLDDLRQTMTEEWVERYLSGSWETFAGQIYKEFQRDLHIVPKMIVPPHWPRFLGMDPGTVNATAVVFIGVDEEGNCLVYNEHYRVSGIIREHAEAILAKCIGDSVQRPDGNSKAVVVWMDPAVKGDHDPEGRDFKQLYEELGIYGLNANKQVAAGIQKVSLLLHPDQTHKFPAWHPRRGELGSPRLFFMDGSCPALLHEIALYEWEQQPEGTQLNKREVPRKYLDHACDALRYTVMAIFEKANPLEKKKDPTYDDWVYAEITGKNAAMKAEVAVPDADEGLWD